MKSDEVVKAVEWKMNVCLLLIGGILKLWHEMYSQWVYPGLRQSERVKLGDEEYSVRRWIEETPLMLKLTFEVGKKRNNEVYAPDWANLACSACVWSSRIFLNDLTAKSISDDDEFEESSSIGGVIGLGKLGDGGSIRKGVSERPRGVLQGEVRSEVVWSDKWEAVELDRRRFGRMLALPRRDREAVGVKVAVGIFGDERAEVA